jgi:hypothetical protein
MISPHFIRTMVMSMLLTVAFGSLCSCISEDTGNCIQYSVRTRLVDRNGKLLPDSIATQSVAYIFRNGKYVYSVPVSSDGTYHVFFNGCDNTCMTVFGNRNISGFELSKLSIGDDMNTIAVKIASLEQAQDSLLHSRLYYGNVTLSNITPDSADYPVTLPMYDNLSRLHVILNNVESLLGTGKYSVKISGLYSEFTYGGIVTGDSRECNLDMTHLADGSYRSGVVSTLPSDTPLTITLYKDGEAIRTVNTDYAGNPITTSGGEEKAIVINAGATYTNTQVMPWGDFVSQQAQL